MAAMHKIVQIVGTAASICALGFGMLIANWHPGIGVALMVGAVFYLLWALLTWPQLVEVLPEPMLRFLAGVMILSTIVAISAEGINERLYPKPARAECDVPDTKSPCELDCFAANDNPVPIREIAIGFVGPLPAQTVIGAAPDMRIQMKKSETLPIPDPNQDIDRSVRSFIVEIPLLSAHSQAPFTIWTDDDINRKACEQAVGIEHKRQAALAEVLQQASARTQTPDLRILSTGLVKRDSLFHPREISSEQGRQVVDYQTKEEKTALAMWDQIRTMTDWKRIFNKQGTCLAPIVHFELTGGSVTSMPFVIPNVEQHSNVFKATPQSEPVVLVPDRYDCTISKTLLK